MQKLTELEACEKLDILINFFKEFSNIFEKYKKD